MQTAIPTTSTGFYTLKLEGFQLDVFLAEFTTSISKQLKQGVTSEYKEVKGSKLPTSQAQAQFRKLYKPDSLIRLSGVILNKQNNMSIHDETGKCVWQNNEKLKDDSTPLLLCTQFEYPRGNAYADGAYCICDKKMSIGVTFEARFQVLGKFEPGLLRLDCDIVGDDVISRSIKYHHTILNLTQTKNPSLGQSTQWLYKL